MVVGSAGTHAEPGEPMCGQAVERAGIDPQQHAAHQLTAELLEAAELVLVADRTQSAQAARLAPRCRPRLFTMTQRPTSPPSSPAHDAQQSLPEGAPALLAHSPAQARLDGH